MAGAARPAAVGLVDHERSGRRRQRWLETTKIETAATAIRTAAATAAAAAAAANSSADELGADDATDGVLADVVTEVHPADAPEGVLRKRTNILQFRDAMKMVETRRAGARGST